MTLFNIESLTAQISKAKVVRSVGRVSGVNGGTIEVSGLSDDAHIGDQLSIERRIGGPLSGEVLQFVGDTIIMMPDASPDGVSLRDRVTLDDASTVAPSPSWIGRIVDPYGAPLDGMPLLGGPSDRPLRADPPAAAQRRPMGQRLDTGMAVFNTLLPIVSGQRIGLFAGSGVGKSTLLAHLARHMTADIVVIAMVGERGRELRNFVDNVLGPEGMKRSIVVAATSDQSPLVRRRCAWTGMAVAEYFRDQGLEVLLLADSITRFAEAHREVAVASGEAPVLRGFPPSTSHMIMSLCERAGPGTEDQGNITALFSVLVAGSDMDEPISDILRGVLDGHVVMDRAIAERGRYPAIDVLRSVSRSLPEAATQSENDLITETRSLLGAYDQNAMMIRAGLYSEGSDPQLDIAIRLWPDLDGFLAKEETAGIENSFATLGLILRRGKSVGKAAGDGHRAPNARAPRTRH